MAREDLEVADPVSIEEGASERAVKFPQVA
jgi:hypothetical protein